MEVFFGLIGLVIGIFSLLMDQYDFEFEAEGELKDVVDGLQSFAEGVKTVADAVKEVIRHLDFNVTCEAIYTALASGSVAAFVTSIIPGIELYSWSEKQKLVQQSIAILAVVRKSENKLK